MDITSGPNKKLNGKHNENKKLFNRFLKILRPSEKLNSAGPVVRSKFKFSEFKSDEASNTRTTSNDSDHA